MLATPLCAGPAVPGQPINPGDILGAGETIAALTTAGAGTWTGAMIATGFIRRTGPGGGYIDTTDTAQNILNALAGNAPAASVKPGTTFRMIFQNTVAQAMTFAAGAGVVAGVGTLTVAASLVRHYLWTVVNSTQEVTPQTTTVNASAAITFTPNLVLGTITPGMVVTAGANITAGTTVLGVTTGPGGITGATLSANATGSGTQGNTFSPQLKIDGLFTGTL